MRLPLIKPVDLTEQQKPLFDDMKQGIAANFQGFCKYRRRWRPVGSLESVAA